MRIAEILFWNNEPTERNRPDNQLDLPPPPFSDDPTNLANAFTRSGLVKHFWNLNGSEGQPSGPAPPDAGTELIPSGTLGRLRHLGRLSQWKQSARWVSNGSFRSDTERYEATDFATNLAS